MNEIVFLDEEAMEGGYTARALDSFKQILLS
jgi:hypothetical protein